MKKYRIRLTALTIVFVLVLIFLNRPYTYSITTPHKPFPRGGVSQSGSIATHYASLRELTASADLIAEVEITGTRGKGPGLPFLGYTAKVADTIAGRSDSEEILLYETAPPETQEGVSFEDRLSYAIGDRHILFLKKGGDSSNDPLYRVSGVYEGRFDIENGAVNAAEAHYGAELAVPAVPGSDPVSAERESYVPGASVEDFKAKIRSLHASVIPNT